jgi:ATP synthase protein I
MSDDRTPRSEGDFDARLKQAQAEFRQESEGKGGGNTVPVSGFGAAFRIGAELVSALVVGLGIGYLLDLWLGTRPWCLVVFFFIGAAAGVLNVYRAASSIGLKDETKQ